MARRGPQVVSNDDDIDNSIDVPRVFICPMFEVGLLTHFPNQFQHGHVDLEPGTMFGPNLGPLFLYKH